MFAKNKLVARHLLRNFAPALLSHYIQRKWELDPECALLPALCSSHQVSFDVGANWGQYTGALRRYSSQVIACEPNPELATFLRRAFPTTVQVEQVALSNRQGHESFIIEEDWGRSSLNTPPTGNGQRSVPVLLNTLDAIATKPVGFVKIDVEGHEEEVIDGAQRVLSEDHPALLVEIEERHRPGALTRIPAKLGQNGYRGFFLQDRVLHTIGTFKTTDHQNPANYRLSSQSRRHDNRGLYINNFVFIHLASLPDKARQLQELGYTLVYS
jgi:FkbM family methyltransferase